MSSTRDSCHILVNVSSSRQIFEKQSSTNYHENPYSVSPVVPCERIDGQTDGETERHGEANSHFLQFLRTSFIRRPL